MCICNVDCKWVKPIKTIILYYNFTGDQFSSAIKQNEYYGKDNNKRRLKQSRNGTINKSKKKSSKICILKESIQSQCNDVPDETIPETNVIPTIITNSSMSSEGIIITYFILKFFFC